MLSAALRATKYLKESVEKETSPEDHQADGHVPRMVGKPPRVGMAVNKPCSSGSTTPRSTSTFVSLGGRNGPEEDNTESAVEVKLTAMRKRFAIPPSPRRLE
ncbi:hypothetical protein FOZ62_002732 [Perkinsus olseni]|uniref:Uncharacterized protein n=2 Tax=Perkinsus olseni TaxID=32597 RepID=A0A7J6TYC1_PEROL|nr:hypothetical protein FOZ62_002732 [Perkinsus olseni]